MRLNPRYGDQPLIVMDGPAGGVAEPVLRQRRRLVDTLATLTDDAWAAPSRCEGWSVRDVLVHLDSTNAFWNWSIGAGRRGEPTRFLAAFDPTATPAELVAAAGDPSPSEVLDRFAASNDQLAETIRDLDEDEWSLAAEAPPGHVAIEVVAHHALWDAWIHERDMLLPLDHLPDQEPDEVWACLRYAAALSPAYALTTGTSGPGRLHIEAHDPDGAITVDVDTTVRVHDGLTGGPPDLTLHGASVELIEVISMRTPPTAEPPADTAWLVTGLATAFGPEP